MKQMRNQTLRQKRKRREKQHEAVFISAHPGRTFGWRQPTRGSGNAFTNIINKERIEPKYTAPDIAPGAFAFLRDTVGRETKSKYIFGR